MPRLPTGIRRLPNGRYVAVACLPGKRHAKRTFDSAQDAANWRMQRIAQERARRGPVRPPMMAEALDRYEAWAKALRPATASFTGAAIRRLRKVPEFQKRLDLVTTEDVAAWRASMALEGLSSRTVDHYTERLNRLLSLAVEWGWLHSAPRARLSRENTERVRYLTPAEEAALLAACGPLLAAPVRFMLATGARKGEVRALRWGMVDETARVAVLPATLAKGKRDRVLVLGRAALEVLAELKRGGPGEPVFRGAKGGVAHRLDHWWKDALEAAVKGDEEAGRPACPSLAGLRIHDLRHTFASRLAMAGVPIYTLAGLLGHSDVRLTMRYAHLSRGHLHEAVEALDFNKVEGR